MWSAPPFIFKAQNERAAAPGAREVTLPPTSWLNIIKQSQEESGAEEGEVYKQGGHMLWSNAALHNRSQPYTKLCRYTLVHTKPHD